jgi:hypothetical protein
VRQPRLYLARASGDRGAVAWFDAGNQAKGLQAVSFDFHRLVEQQAPARRLVEAGNGAVATAGGSRTRDGRVSVPRALEGDAMFGRLTGFCRATGLDLSAMVFDDRQNWTLIVTAVLIPRWSRA